MHIISPKIHTQIVKSISPKTMCTRAIELQGKAQALYKIPPQVEGKTVLVSL